MDRRDQGGQQEAPEQTETDRRIDALVAAGWEFRDAYAEVHDLSGDELRSQERRAMLDTDRRAGETREQTARRLYSEWVHLQYLAAEQATRGHVLTAAGQAAGIDPIELFSGPVTRARKWASEDLKRWWADNRRLTYTEFRADLLGDAADKAEAAQLRTRANERDFAL